MTVRSHPGGRPQTADRAALTRTLENRALLIEDALGEFWLGIASEDLRLATAAARRLESIGAVMGHDVRKFERGSGSGRRAAAASAPPTATRRP